MRNLRIAVGLLTIIPIRLPQDWRAGDSGRAAAWFPLVGLFIGALTWLAWQLAYHFFPPFVSGVLALMIWIFLSGGLHLDGLADCCDGLFVSAPVEKRLEIMKDPRLGTFGGAGLLLVLLLKAAALGALSPSSAPAIILAAVFGRWCIMPAALLPLARQRGMGADFSAGLRGLSIWIGGLLPLVLALLLGLSGIAALLMGLVVMGAVLRLAITRIKGVTGDVFGALVEITEAVILLVFTFGVK